MNFLRTCSRLAVMLPQRWQPPHLHPLTSIKAAFPLSTSHSSRHLPAISPLQCNCVRTVSYVTNETRPFLQTMRTGNHQSSIFSLMGLQSVRCKARGNEYQPSVRKRLRKHGYHKRMKTISGMEILWRRMLKGKTLLVHGNFNRKPFKGV